MFTRLNRKYPPTPHNAVSPIMLVTSHHLSVPDKERITQLFFERFGVPAFAIYDAGLLALYAAGVSMPKPLAGFGGGRKAGRKRFDGKMGRRNGLRDSGVDVGGLPSGAALVRSMSPGCSSVRRMQASMRSDGLRCLACALLIRWHASAERS